MKQSTQLPFLGSVRLSVAVIVGGPVTPGAGDAPNTSRPPVTGDMFLTITGTSAPGPPAPGGWKRRTRAGTGRHAT
ncbi:MAG: hypothetical protein AUH31_09540 [Armatimonadetes bacterium 13_1_40CM_64_14]|nr:MAG: hypothetical protein AUH31_09540 [Armatimonadetes bacterium 13_1_40CM_64_14]